MVREEKQIKALSDWATAFSKFTPTMLTLENFRLFSALLVYENETQDLAKMSDIVDEETFMIKIIQVKLTGFENMTMSPSAIVWLSSHCSTPGIAVMLLAYTYWRAKNALLEKVTISNMGHTIFPDGIPTHEWLVAMWDRQKLSPGSESTSDNLLDAIMDMQHD